MTKQERNERIVELRKSGKSTYELARLFGLDRTTIGDILKKYGVKSCTKGTKSSDEEVARNIERLNIGFTYSHGYQGTDKTVFIRCNKCGEIIERNYTTIRHKNVRCDKCKKKKEAYKAVRKAVLKIKRIKEKEEAEAKRNITHTKQCVVCGNTFTAKNKRAVCCSGKCTRKRNNSISTQRKRLRRKNYMQGDKDISLLELYKKEKGKCYLCGGNCDLNDYVEVKGSVICGDNYPSIDHVIPLSKGGMHTWNNVRLAHRICNTKKGNRA